MTSKKKRPKNIPLSGDVLVDTFFEILIEALEKTIESVRMKKILLDPDDRRKELHGLLSEGKIYLGKHKHKVKKSPLVKTLIHELLHAITDVEVVREWKIRRLERVLYIRFTDVQKRFLRRYIPKHEVKEEPPTNK